MSEKKLFKIDICNLLLFEPNKMYSTFCIQKIDIYSIPYPILIYLLILVLKIIFK